MSSRRSPPRRPGIQLFPEYTDELYARIDEIAHKDLDEALSIAEKLPRQDRIHEIKEHVREVLADEVHRYGRCREGQGTR